MVDKFNPSEHLTQIKGKDYLEVKWRLVWFREEHPDWSIETEVADRGDGWALMKATIKNDQERIIATGHKAETKSGFGDYLEKAETGAIGRALAACGFGTQFSPELEEGDRIVDSPVETNKEEKVKAMTVDQSKAIYATVLRKTGRKDTYSQVKEVNRILGTDYKRLNELSLDEAKTVIDRLNTEIEAEELPI